MCRLRFRKEYIQFSDTIIEEKAYFLENYANFLYNSMANLFNLCTSGTLVRKVVPKYVPGIYLLITSRKIAKNEKFINFCNQNCA